jgi:hypothetical protein
MRSSIFTFIIHISIKEQTFTIFHVKIATLIHFRKAISSRLRWAGHVARIGILVGKKMLHKVEAARVHKSIQGSGGTQGAFITSATDGGYWSVSQLGNLARGRSPRYPLDRRLGVLRAALDAVETRKLSARRLKSNPGLPDV